MRCLTMVALMLAGCGSQVGPLESVADYPVTAFNPADNPNGWQTHDYPKLWEQMERCSGVQRDYGAVTWYMLSDPDQWSYRTPRGEAGGTWLLPENAIILPQPRMTNARVVQHEMLHAITRQLYHGPVFDRCDRR